MFHGMVVVLHLGATVADEDNASRHKGSGEERQQSDHGGPSRRGQGHQRDARVVDKSFKGTMASVRNRALAAVVTGSIATALVLQGVESRRPVPQPSANPYARQAKERLAMIHEEVERLETRTLAEKVTHIYNAAVAAHEIGFPSSVAKLPTEE